MKNLNAILFLSILLAIMSISRAIYFYSLKKDTLSAFEYVKSKNQESIELIKKIDNIEKLKSLAIRNVNSIEDNMQSDIDIIKNIIELSIYISVIFIIFVTAAVFAKREIISNQSLNPTPKDGAN